MHEQRAHTGMYPATRRPCKRLQWVLIEYSEAGASELMFPWYLCE